MTVKRKNFYLITLHGAYTLGYAVPVNTISINTGYGDHYDCLHTYLYRMKMYLSTGVLTGSSLTRKLYMRYLLYGQNSIIIS